MPDLVVHAFTDGRDTLPHGGAGYLAELERWLRHAGRIGTVSGRYYAMDRDTPLGADQARLRRDRPRRGPPRADAPRRRSRTSYERGRDRRVHRADGDRRLRRRWPTATSVLHFNFRPDRARAADQGARRAGLRRVRPRRRAPVEPDDDDRVPQGLALPGRVPAARPGDDAGRGDRRGRASASCTSPRPRSTPTSPTSSTAAARQEWEGEERRLVDSPRDVATYDHKPEMSARAAADAFARALGARTATASGSSTSPTPTWSATPASSRPRSPAVEDGRRAASARWSRRSTSRAAPASSPPTTATATTCSSPTARPTPPTRPTRCR